MMIFIRAAEPEIEIGMKLIAWNVNHRARARPIVPSMAPAIGSQRPDVVVLTEYVPGSTHDVFLRGLAEYGLTHALASAYTKGENGVLIMSRTRIQRGAIKAPPISPSVPSNVLHVLVPNLGLEVLGIRIPDFSKSLTLKRACWDWIQETANVLRRRPSVIVGDFNTARNYSRARCGDRIDALLASGWQLASPPEGASYWTPKGHGVQIDHAFVSPNLKATSARYVAAESGHVFAGKTPDALSDHAVLSVSIETAAHS